MCVCVYVCMLYEPKKKVNERKLSCPRHVATPVGMIVAMRPSMSQCCDYDCYQASRYLPVSASAPISSLFLYKHDKLNKPNIAVGYDMANLCRIIGVLQQAAAI